MIMMVSMLMEMVVLEPYGLVKKRTNIYQSKSNFTLVALVISYRNFTYRSVSRPTRVLSIILVQLITKYTAAVMKKSLYNSESKLKRWFIFMYWKIYIFCFYKFHFIYFFLIYFILIDLKIYTINRAWIIFVLSFKDIAMRNNNPQKMFVKCFSN